MKPRTLLITGINYAPEPTGTALNTTGLAEGLAATGWRVHVLTGVPHYPAWRRSPAPMVEKRNGVSINRHSHYIPRTQTAMRRAAYEATWVASSVLPLLSHQRPSVVLGVVPSLGGAVLAGLAAVRFDAPMYLLIQDLVGRAAELSGIPGGSRVHTLVESVEVRLVRRATGVFVVADAFERYLRDRGVDPGRICRIRNPARLPPATEERAETRHRLGWHDHEFVVLHTGSMGYKQGLESAIDAASLLSDASVRLVLIGAGSRKDALVSYASRSANVDFLPLVDPGDYGNVLRAADALLLNQAPSVRNMSLPAKLGSYFAAGVPVIAAVDAGDEVAREVATASAGVVVPAGSPERLAHAVRQLASDELVRRSMGANGQRFAAERLREDTVVRLVDSIISRTL